MGRLKPAKMTEIRKREINWKQCSAHCTADQFLFKTTAEVAPLQDGIFGQPRAVKAMDFGLRVKHQGYNLFIAGPPGTGKTMYAKTKVGEVAAKEATPGDWVYVYNFQQPDRPLALRLSPDEGIQFKKDMKELIDDLKSEIRKAFEGEEYENRRNELVRSFEGEISSLWHRVEAESREKGFVIQRTPTGFTTIPIKEDGSPLTKEEYHNLPPDVREAIRRTEEEIEHSIADSLRKTRQIEKTANQQMKSLDQQVARFVINQLMDHLFEQYGRYPKVVRYLEQVREDVVENLADFRNDGDGEEAAGPFAALQRMQRGGQMAKYEVNVFTAHGKDGGAPVVFESNPTYYNLFGRIEYKGSFGTMVTDFTMIKPGAVQMANGGYLILKAEDLLANPYSWLALKRALRTQEVQMENLDVQLGLTATTSLRPEPLPVNLKVILIGSHYLYQLLNQYDEDFRKLFKVKVDFDSAMDRTPVNLEKYAGLMSSVCETEGLPPFDAGAVARIIDHASRSVSDQTKLSACFHDIKKLMVEAAVYAEQEGKAVVSQKDVNKALDERVYRLNRVEERIRELILEGTYLVDTEGEAVGRVNGLAVLNVGDHAFGKPSRISARYYLGQRGIVNIEREVDQSGPSHSKGVGILSSFFLSKFGRTLPLAFSAVLTFEQTYDMVDGDSASSTELYALLSAISEIPIKQSIAVTGSVNQHGEIQPIGGVNEKVEGFFFLCKARGLTGDQGVMIPRQNVKNLMLHPEVIEAVREGKFHIWAVGAVEEGIEILTGVQAGKPREDGAYPAGTVFGEVQQNLKALADIVKEQGKASRSVRTTPKDKTNGVKKIQ